MAFRQIHTKIWRDPWFLDLPPDHKLLFIYLFSNDSANLMGLYEISRRTICFETDLERSVVESALEQFAAAGKVFYEDHYIWIVNLFHYNANNPSSPKTQAHIRKTLDDMPDIPLKARMIWHYQETEQVLDGYDTRSIPFPQEQEQEQEQDQDQEQETKDAAIAGADAPLTFQEWQERIEHPPDGSNRTAQLVSMYATLYPGRSPPEFGYMGKMARDVGGAGRMAELLWQASTRPPAGDILRYCARIAKGQRPKQASGRDSADPMDFISGEYAEYIEH